jgi:nucleolysin TIA-1/TIAR
MWDMKTGRSRGYGFVAFRERPDAEKALSSMDGEWLGSRAIRCNWANQKGQPSIAQQQAMQQMGMTPTTPYGHHHFPTHGMGSYDMIVGQTPAWQTTCYVGNLTPYTTQNDLVPLFQNFGYVVESRFQSDRGFAFIKMDTHENAAMAICQLNGYNVNGRPLKCSVRILTIPTTSYLLWLTTWDISGVRTKHQTRKALIQINLRTVPQALRAPAILPLLISTFPNMVVSLASNRTDASLQDADMSAGGQYAGQQANFAGPSAQSPASYGSQPPMSGGYGGPPSAGGYGRGQPAPAQQWTPQAPQAQSFNNGFAGYQG